MQDVIGFVVFAVIAAISIYSKYREQKQAEEAARERRAQQRPEDLPESTRKMLYGETGLPPGRGGAPEPEIRTAQRREVPLPGDRPAPQPQHRPAPPRPVQPRPVPVPQRPVSQAPPPMPARRQQAPMPSAAEAEQKRVARQQAQMTLEEMWRQSQAAKARQQRPVQPQRVPQPKRAKPVVAVEPEPEGARIEPRRQPAPTYKTSRNSGFPAFLKGQGALRTGIVLAEVLGPPVSLRPGESGGLGR